VGKDRWVGPWERVAESFNEIELLYVVSFGASDKGREGE